jgi:CRP-like cAMP-binding protein
VYTSSIHSETEVEVVRIRGNALRKVCRENPEIGCILLDRLAESVSGRWKNSREQVHAILDRNINNREKAK